MTRIIYGEWKPPVKQYPVMTRQAIKERKSESVRTGAGALSTSEDAARGGDKETTIHPLRPRPLPGAGVSGPRPRYGEGNEKFSG